MRGARPEWLLIKHPDASARAGDADDVLRVDASVASGRSMREIAAGALRKVKPFMLRRPPDRTKALPGFIAPQLCTLVARPPEGPNWVHEVKFDGYRSQLHVVGGKARVFTRRGLDWTSDFSAIAHDAEALPDCIIDGEIVALDRRRKPSFTALQAALAEGESQSLVLFAFDLLFEGREDLRARTLGDRKRRLKQLLRVTDGDERVRYVEHFASRGEALLRSACQSALEGIVSKKLDAPYRSGRSGDWTKAKCRAGQEVVLGGWAESAGNFRSLLAGVQRNGVLQYVGRIGTGFGRATVSNLMPTLQALSRAKSPFAGKNAPRAEVGTRWLKPSLVAEIDFAGWTGSGMIRQASFKGLRADKRARDVVAERAMPPPSNPRAARSLRAQSDPASVMGVPISRPNKWLWPPVGDNPAVTKLSLAQYFEAVGTWMMPHLASRPCSLLRLPEGLGGPEFLQRHPMAGLSDRFELVTVRGERTPYLQINRIEALAAVAQLGALEIHSWNSAPFRPEVADRLVFDLDPGPDVGFDAVVAAALDIRERLRSLGLISFCKTTGGKGLHVVTPLTSGKRPAPWPLAKDFARSLCACMADEDPTRYTSTMSKAKRVGKIFLDYLRNDHAATAVAVLSPRARAGAPVSMPLPWKFVRRGLNPQVFTVQSAPQLLRDMKPWKSYEAARRPLPARRPATRQQLQTTPIRQRVAGKRFLA
jgi:bifunctional non-homologous end joining protein LigD